MHMEASTGGKYPIKPFAGKLFLNLMSDHGVKVGIVLTLICTRIETYSVFTFCLEIKVYFQHILTFYISVQWKQRSHYKRHTKEVFLRSGRWLCQWPCQKPQLGPAPETPQYFLTALKGHFVYIWGSFLSWSVKVTYFLVIWYNNSKTALAFTWKEQHGGDRDGGGDGGARRAGRGSCGKGNLQKTDNNAVICPHKQPSCLLILW